VRALYDYQSNDPSSLSFRRADIIEVLTRLESGWWDGLLNDERGWFPSNYVEVLETAEADAILRQQNREDQSSIAPSQFTDSIVDMASVMGQGQDGSWMDTSEIDLRNALSGVVHQPSQQQSTADFWLPNVGADGRVRNPVIILLSSR
jgi:son of sevenless-like protein